MTIQGSSVAIPQTLSARMARVATVLRDTGLGYTRLLRAEQNWPRLRNRLPARDPRHVFIIAASLPPRSGSGVFRPASWLTYGPANGWRSTALTRTLDEPPDAAGQALYEALPHKAGVIGVPAPDIRPSHKLYPQIDGGIPVALAMYRTGVAVARMQPPSVVVATGPSFNMFVAGFYLARRLAIPLVLDYRDEWSENPYPATGRNSRMDRWWEARCLAAADTVVFTTKSQLYHADAVFGGGLVRRSIVLPNGWDPDAAPGTPLPREADTLEIAFSGWLGTHTLPDTFLSDCAALGDHRSDCAENLRLRFVGRRHAEADAVLQRHRYPDSLILDGMQPKETADATIRNADAVLLITKPHMARYMSAKMFEYMACGRPILVHGCAGEMADIAVGTGAGLFVAEGDTDSLAAAIETIRRRPPESWDTPARQAWAAEHRRKELAARFYELLDRVVAGEPANMSAPP